MGSVQQRANRPFAAATLARLLRTSLLVAPCLLGACSTPQERAARKQAEVEQMMVVYGPACQRLGYTPNTDAWRSCVLQLNAQDDLLRYQTSPGYYCDGWGAGYRRAGCW